MLKKELNKRGVSYHSRDSKPKLTDRLQEFLAKAAGISKEILVQLEELVPELVKSKSTDDKFTLGSLRGELEKRLHVKPGGFDSAKDLIKNLAWQIMSGKSSKPRQRRTRNGPRAFKKSEPTSKWISNDYPRAEGTLQRHELGADLARMKRYHKRMRESDPSKSRVEEAVDILKTKMEEHISREGPTSGQKRPLDKIGCKLEVAFLEWHERADEMQKLHARMLTNAEKFGALREVIEKSFFQKVANAGRKSRRTRDDIDSESCDSS